MVSYTEEYISDLRKIQEVITNIDTLEEKTVMVTGAGGLIGSAVVDFLLELNRSRNYRIDIYAAGRRMEKMQERFQGGAAGQRFHYLKYDALEAIEAEMNFDFIIHGAGNANPGIFITQPVETMLANFIGIKNLLDYAKAGKAGRIVYISSGEVYGKKTDGQPYSETDYGFLDLLNPRACYPSAKRAAETLCASYQKEYGIDYVTVRPGHVYGPTATDTDNRASSLFSRMVKAGRDIVMNSIGNQLRSYCYVLDCTSAIMAVMINGESGNAYNISNRNSIITIREMAECFAAVSGQKVIFEAMTEEEKAGYNLMDNSSLLSGKLEGLGWRGLFDMEAGAKRTLASM